MAAIQMKKVPLPGIDDESIDMKKLRSRLHGQVDHFMDHENKRCEPLICQDRAVFDAVLGAVGKLKDLVDAKRARGPEAEEDEGTEDEDTEDEDEDEDTEYNRTMAEVISFEHLQIDMDRLKDFTYPPELKGVIKQIDARMGADKVFMASPTDVAMYTPPKVLVKEQQIKTQEQGARIADMEPADASDASQHHMLAAVLAKEIAEMKAREQAREQEREQEREEMKAREQEREQEMKQMRAVIMGMMSQASGDASASTCIEPQAQAQAQAEQAKHSPPIPTQAAQADASDASDASADKAGTGEPVEDEVMVDVPTGTTRPQRKRQQNRKLNDYVTGKQLRSLKTTNVRGWTVVVPRESWPEEECALPERLAHNADKYVRVKAFRGVVQTPANPAGTRWNVLFHSTCYTMEGQPTECVMDVDDIMKYSEGQERPETVEDITELTKKSAENYQQWLLTTGKDMWGVMKRK